MGVATSGLSPSAKRGEKDFFKKTGGSVPLAVAVRMSDDAAQIRQMCRMTTAVDQLCSSASRRAPHRFPRKYEKKPPIERAADVPALELPLL